MDREARVETRSGVHVRHRVECLLKAISACHKCDLDSAQVCNNSETGGAFPPLIPRVSTMMVTPHTTP